MISYWSTFDFDITNYIDLLDIPKSFVFPLATSIGVSLISLILSLVIRSINKMEKNDKKNEELLKKIDELPTKTLFQRIINDYNVWVAVILFTCLIFYRPRREWVFVISGITITIYAISKLMRNPEFIKLLPNFSLRFFVAVLLRFVPVYSFLIGKLNAIEIWENKKYYKVTDVTFKDITNSSNYLKSTKLLGKLGNYIFLADSLNTKISAINLEAIYRIEYSYINSMAK